MYRQVQCLYCPSGCRHRLRSRPCMHGPGAAASLQVSARTRAPFSRALGLGDTERTCALSPPHGSPQPPWPAGSPPSRRGCARQLSGNKPAAAERPRGPVRGTARGGLSLSSEPREVGGEHAQGPGAICSSPARVPVGRGPARAGMSTTGHGHGAVAGLSPWSWN